ncbi:MAG: DNA primase [Bacteroidota bacterium]
MISPHTIEKVKELDLVTVIQDYGVSLKKTGSSWTAKSPFNPEEKTASFSVHRTRNVWKCFSTGIGGHGPINFVMEYQKMDFVSAIKDLCDKFGIPFEQEKETKEQIQTRESKESLYRLNKAAAKRYYEQLVSEKIEVNHPAFKEIVDKRKYTADTVTQWQLGYAPDEWQFISEPILESKFFQEAKKLGLIKEKNDRSYDAFRNRLMFPIHDDRGNIVAFGGRDLSGLTGKEKPPKYINSPESDIFSKSEILYGLYYAQNHIRTAGYAYLTEGYTDVISFHERGFCNTVGTCGTSLTEEHLKRLKLYTDKVVVLFDADKAGLKAAVRAIEMVLQAGLNVAAVKLPEKLDPDEFIRVHENPEDYLLKYQRDGIYFYAECIKPEEFTPIHKAEFFDQLSGLLVHIDNAIIREEYIRNLAKTYENRFVTLNKLVEDKLARKEQEDEKKEVARKNKVLSLNGNASIWPFFHETLDKKGTLQKITVDKLKFVQLLAHFGYTRYDIAENSENFTFIKIEKNIIREVNKEEIIDHVEHFIKNDYDFEGANVEIVDSERLINKLYDGIKVYFSRDLFNRVRLERPVIINRDTKDTTFFYFNNGFVEVNDKGWELKPYEKMNGSVWANQMFERDFAYRKVKEGLKPIENGVFADFVWKLSDENEERFANLCQIIGYMIHDFYDYKLKAILLTDSSLSENSDGRSGKTLLGKLIGQVRGYTEINGKDFNTGEKTKYQDVEMGTQIIHLNDVKTKGRNRFYFEDVFNDVTEGITVDAKYMVPFRKQCKMMISTNRTLEIKGGSQRDRIIEFDVSTYFSEKHSPLDEYKHWLMKDWDQEEWNNFYNFMAYCAHKFHVAKQSLPSPKGINLDQRKLREQTAPEFLEFVREVNQNLHKNGIPYDGYEILPRVHGDFPPNNIPLEYFPFDRKQFYEQFKKNYPDFEQRWFTNRKFKEWLEAYARYQLKIREVDTIFRRSNNVDWVQFKHPKQ